MIPDQVEKRCRFDLVEGAQIDFDPSSGTVQRGNADCPCCNQVAPVEYLRSEAQKGRMSEQLMAVVLVSPERRGKTYRAATKNDVDIFVQASSALKQAIAEYGTSIVPSEPISKNARGQISPPIYGLNTRFSSFFRLTLLAYSA